MYAIRSYYGIRAWGEGWWDMNIATGNRVAEIIGAPANSVSMHQNISLASQGCPA